MKDRSVLSRLRAVSCLLLLLSFAGAADAQQCLHGPDESASERSRREAAVDFVARLNAAQKAALEERGTYVALTDAVPPGDVPLGFVPRVTFDRWSYAVSLKDLFDPCGFALFSDQDGRVYEARPVSHDAAGDADDVEDGGEEREDARAGLAGRADART